MTGAAGYGLLLLRELTKLLKLLHLLMESIEGVENYLLNLIAIGAINTQSSFKTVEFRIQIISLLVFFLLNESNVSGPTGWS